MADSEDSAKIGNLTEQPVGSGEYVVQQGDCISSIAHRAGHFWQTIWNHPDNAELKRIRKDPNILLPGDRVAIRPLEIKNETRPTDQRHKFVRKGEPAKLRLRVMIEDDDDTPESGPGAQSADSSGSGETKRLPQPRADQPYVLQLDGTLYQGQTDADGMIDIYIPPGARSGRLTIGPDNMVIPIQLGSLDPLTGLSGIQERLNNLGFNCGAPDGMLSNRTMAALQLFQRQYGLEQSGEPDAASIAKLKEVHGS